MEIGFVIIQYIHNIHNNYATQNTTPPDAMEIGFVIIQYILIIRLMDCLPRRFLKVSISIHRNSIVRHTAPYGQ